MAEYRVAVGFWLHAYEYIEIEAEDADAAIEVAKAKAAEVMTRRSPPDGLDDERRGGFIGFIDLLPDNDPVCEGVEFDDEIVTITSTREKGFGDPI